MYIMCILAVFVRAGGGGGAKGVTSIFSLGNFLIRWNVLEHSHQC